jgi:hypothetical protein
MYLNLVTHNVEVRTVLISKTLGHSEELYQIYKFILEKGNHAENAVESITGKHF